MTNDGDHRPCTGRPDTCAHNSKMRDSQGVGATHVSPDVNRGTVGSVHMTALEGNRTSAPMEDKP